MDVKIEVRKVTTATAMTVTVAINACGFIIPPFLNDFYWSSSRAKYLLKSTAKVVPTTFDFYNFSPNNAKSNTFLQRNV
jgi:cytochrome b subunit of formate dehydrogenase